MTVNSTKSVKSYSGNGATTVFAYDFLIPSATEVSVYLTLKSTGAVTVLSTSEYSITGIDSAAFGNVTYPLSGSPLSALYKITIERVIPYTQPNTVPNQGNLYAETVEDSIDRIAMLIQQVEGHYSRSIRLAMSDDEISPLPDATERANMSLLFDASGDPTVGAVATAVVSAAMVPVVQAATLALAREAFTTAFMAGFLAAADAAAARSAIGLGGTVALTSDTNRKIRTANTMARIAFTQ